MKVRAPEHFVITLSGTVARASRRLILHPGALPHLLTRLMTGEPIADEALQAFGIRVLIDEDTDQGDG